VWPSRSRNSTLFGTDADRLRRMASMRCNVVAWLMPAFPGILTLRLDETSKERDGPSASQPRTGTVL